jgi:hypothetical protein
MEIVPQQICELVRMEECGFKAITQIAGMASLTALAIAAMLFDGSIGEGIGIAVAGGMGLMVGYLFPSPLQK